MTRDAASPRVTPRNPKALRMMAERVFFQHHRAKPTEMSDCDRQTCASTPLLLPSPFLLIDAAPRSNPSSRDLARKGYRN